MSKLITLTAEVLTAGAFAPFGWIIAGSTEEPTFARPGLDVWAKPFSSDAPARIQIMRYHRRPWTFSRLERHLYVTESRIPLSNATTVLVVGPPDASESAPAPETLRAFRLNQDSGLMFKPGVWHTLDCFVADAPYADFVMLSDVDTEREIEQSAETKTGARTHVADYLARHDCEFEVVLPG